MPAQQDLLMSMIMQHAAKSHANALLPAVMSRQGQGESDTGSDDSSLPNENQIFQMLLQQNQQNSLVGQGRRVGIGGLINGLVGPWMTAKAMTPLVMAHLKAQSAAAKQAARQKEAQIASSEATARYRNTQAELAPQKAEQQADLAKARTEQAQVGTALKEQQMQVNAVMTPMKLKEAEQKVRNAEQTFSQRQQKFPVEMANAEEKLRRSKEAEVLGQQRIDLAKAKLDHELKKDPNKEKMNPQTALKSWTQAYFVSQFRQDASGKPTPQVFGSDQDAISFAERLQAYKQMAVKAGNEPSQMNDVAVVSVPGRVYGTSGYRVVSSDRAKVEAAQGSQVVWPPEMAKTLSPAQTGAAAMSNDALTKMLGQQVP